MNKTKSGFQVILFILAIIATVLITSAITKSRMRDVVNQYIVEMHTGFTVEHKTPLQFKDLTNDREVDIWNSGKYQALGDTGYRMSK
jgi:hypothetical protein